MTRPSVAWSSEELLSDDDWFDVDRDGLPQQHDDEVGTLEYLVFVATPKPPAAFMDIATFDGREWSPRTYRGTVTHWQPINEPQFKVSTASGSDRVA